ncbi:MAG TPA: metallophosphoesterase family protein [bacterium]|nr:metallophosphoesterase family protein [bacterium]
MAIAIGDIHGCLEPLRALIADLPPGRELVFLGDYVDRGPQSAQVLDYLQALAEERPCVFLEGNHEAMMAEAIERTEAISLWLINGGGATLASYNEESYAWARRPPEERRLPGFERFRRGLRLWYEDAHAIYVHAGIDVDIDRMEAQEPKVLLWIRERFFRNAERWHGKPIIFGHTPTQTMGLAYGELFCSHKVTGIDTGCVYGGVLTALDAETTDLWQVPAGFVGHANYR